LDTAELYAAVKQVSLKVKGVSPWPFIIHLNQVIFLLLDFMQKYPSIITHFSVFVI